ncbi:DUF2851 family protein [Mucilaginibacter arboris]|uniref:DUF2851 family protein n=1 Tax=Mucilaginibacter arboris TaxID=2682090 RepID=A0A7K1SXN1_9SPHI|nr:DUF2851 family protein [Mucilaginibacter arboris]MVN22008.1 DUF2851 family protein [Mucilaginibacter arboris]
MIFAEDLLHYIWKFRLYNNSDLCTADGFSLKVLSPGIHHHHAGPDFQNAKIQIGETLWVGNVEIHIRSSDWIRHEHHQDNSYNNVILHVVYKNDFEVINNYGLAIPVLVLEERIADGLLQRYQNLMFAGHASFPCEKIINRVDVLTKQTWLDRMLIQRLEEKSAQVLKTVALLRGNWEEAFYQLLAANFGFKVNALPFELLAKSLPLPILAKHTFNLMQTEALLFGQAGFLEEDLDDLYFLTLQKEYRFLKQKYNLQPIEKHLWKFLRLRPLNFPTIRIAQFAALMHRSNRFLAEIIKAGEVEKINASFTGINPSAYWLDHYLFGKTAKPIVKKLGQTSVENILINTVTIFLFAYGKENKADIYISKAIKILENLPCENNFIISSFISAGIKVGSAGSSQAVIELKNNYCDQKRCLECGIGNKLLKFS